jgi:hypothetical protein
MGSATGHNHTPTNPVVDLVGCSNEIAHRALPTFPPASVGPSTARTFGLDPTKGAAAPGMGGASFAKTKPRHPVATMAGSAAITPSDFSEVIGSPQQWEVADITGRRWNFGGLRR